MSVECDSMAIVAIKKSAELSRKYVDSCEDKQESKEIEFKLFR
jgi:hypothetical protein